MLYAPRIDSMIHVHTTSRDRLGFWVITKLSWNATDWRAWQPRTRKKAAEWTTDHPDWTQACVDRAEALVKRDQLHACVIIWSLGNEAFFGRNFVAMYDHIKAYDDSRPMHYEADHFADTMDMYSRMYPSIEEIVAFAQDKTKTKPLVLCEFIQAMDSGPGTIKEHVDSSLSVQVTGSPKGENPSRTLPRIGLVLEMPGGFHSIEWFGRGPGECYRDSKLSRRIDRLHGGAAGTVRGPGGPATAVCFPGQPLSDGGGGGEAGLAAPWAGEWQLWAPDIGCVRVAV